MDECIISKILQINKDNDNNGITGTIFIIQKRICTSLILLLVGADFNC
jgi:hypothetical protein